MCKIIVVVPAPGASRSGRIYPLLESLSNQTIKPDKVVVIGTSQDDWSEAQNNYDFLISIAFDKPKDHVGRDANIRRSLGLNRALEEDPDFVWFSDVKMGFAPHMFELALNLMQEHDVHVVAGNTFSESDWRNGSWTWKKFLEGYSDAALVKKMPEFPKAKVLTWETAGESESFIVTGNVVLDRHAAEIFKAVGGPPRHFTVSYEDYSFGMRLLGANLPILVTNQVLGSHEHRTSLKGVVTEHMRSGWAAAQLHAEEPGFSYSKRRWKQARMLPAMLMLYLLYAMLFPISMMMVSILGLVSLSVANAVKARHIFGLLYPPINIVAILCFLIGFWDHKFRIYRREAVSKAHIEKFYFQT